MKIGVKKIIICLVIVFSIISFYCFSNKNKNSILLNKIYNDIFSNLEKVQNRNVNNVFISIWDEKRQAIVNVGTGDNVHKAFQKAMLKSLKSIKKDYTIKLVKIDFVKDVSIVQKNEIDYYIKNSYGIALDRNFTIAFLNEELTLGNLWAKNKYQTLNNLNNYLKYHHKKMIEELPDNYYIFQTNSFIYDDGILISSDLLGTSREQQIDVDNILNIMNNATHYLIKEQNMDGSFVYGYNATKDTIIEGYNMIRHCGTLVALAEQASLNKDKKGIKKALQKGISYIENHTVENNDNLYVYQDKKIKLGANALALLAITKYMEVYGTEEYLELGKKLANGIISMQNQKSGQFTFSLSLPSLKPLLNNTKHSYYEGEAAYALARFYGITRNKIYIDASSLAVDYFIENQYEQYEDHWISYASNEITKYIPQKKYLELGIKNYINKKEKFLQSENIFQTDFELIMNTLELYNRFHTQYDDDLLNLIKKGMESRIHDYLFKENYMYLTNPLKYQNVFCVKSSSCRIRIDDVQHSLSGVYLYYKNIDLISN